MANKVVVKPPHTTAWASVPVAINVETIYYVATFIGVMMQIGDRYKFVILQSLTEERTKYYHKIGIFLCDCGKTRKGVIRKPPSSCGCRKMEDASKRLYGRYKHSAKKKNRIFSLSINDFKKLIKGNCFYCNNEPSATFGNNHTKNKIIYNGIDRQDNNIGYCPSNCVSCCSICNRAKSTATVSEFISMCQRVSKHTGAK